MEKQIKSTVILGVFGLLLPLLGGCTTSVDRFFKDLINPSAQAQPVAAKIPPHDSWCYHTLGEVDCYTEAQGHEAERLVAVDPPVKTPSTRAEHTKASLQKQESTK